MTEQTMSNQIELNQTKELQVKSTSPSTDETNVDARFRNTTLQTNKQRKPITLQWNKISYSLPVRDPNGRCCGPKIQKQILFNMSGIAKPGQLVAIMGPSGSGKTTLLSVLAGRIIAGKGKKLHGEVKVNGVNRNTLGSKFARISAFVQQDDVLFSLQTVRETLLTAAHFRLPHNVSVAQKMERVDGVISELGLTKAQHTHIGDAKIRGVSGGERKRTNIGVELIQDPSLLFLDEPTSGLDSFQALNVIQTLKVLCQSGTTVVLSIHQPRSSIFALFDQMIILAEGHVVYDGAPGQTSVEYFGALGFQCPDLYNPADYFLDIVSVDQDQTKSEQRIALLINAYKEHENNSLQDSGNEDEQVLDKFEDVTSVRSACCTQLRVLAKRNFRQLTRDKVALFMRGFMSIFFALFLSALYSETDYGQKSIQDRSGILFFIGINQSFGGMFNTVNAFVLEKAIVMRERQAKSYHISSYYLTKICTALPIDMMAPLVFSCVLYWIVGLNDDPFAFVAFLVITVAVSLAAIGLGFCVGSMTDTVETAAAIAPVVMVMMILFGGFYINTENIPEWLAYLTNFSTIQWSYGAYVINEFTDSKFTCDDVSDGQCITDGEHVIELLSFEQYTMWQCVGYLFILCGSFHVFAFLMLRFKRTKYLDITQYNENDDDKSTV
eukprot:434084_1